MSDEQPQKRSLSEISHLFLSSVRDKQTQGAPRPQRIPPGTARAEESHPAKNSEGLTSRLNHLPPHSSRFAQPEAVDPVRRSPTVSAVIGAHFNGSQPDRVKEYARHLAATHGRIGLIELDASEFRLMSFEAGTEDSDLQALESESAECCNPHQISEALQEMNWDVDRWLLSIPNPRTPEARALLRAVGHWVLLSTCDHDGIISSYRTLKGLDDASRPRLSLALVDAADTAETHRVYRKLSGVCRQFLNWDMEQEPAIGATSHVLEHLVLFRRPKRDKGQIAAMAQWGIVGEFLKNVHPVSLETLSPVECPQVDDDEEELMKEMNEQSPAMNFTPEKPVIASPSPKAAETINQPPASPAFAKMSYTAAPPAAPLLSGPASTFTSTRDTTTEVLELATDGGTDSILTAILQQNHGEMIECPIRAPMCAERASCDNPRPWHGAACRRPRRAF